MIKVLQDWQEIGSAVKFLNRKGLPKHHSPEKNWDLYQLYMLAEPLSRQARVIDLGCAGNDTLRFLHALGFTDLAGIDLAIGVTDRLHQLAKMWRGHSWHVPFRLRRQDLTATNFPAATFDLAVCLSVIEHGVDERKFLAEVCRILKPGGLLFVTTDYWQEPLSSNGDAGGEPFGLPWRPYARKDIERLVGSAVTLGFQPCADAGVPPVADKPVVWNQREFTFISMAFQKR